ncbi:MAG: PQQ-like beta-propeller repeat protein [Cyclobacteriaceae bacterium]|nr:PQQ-like beta-propeller repeat protein [Cyclobacteriaceae bacterium]
MKYVILNLLSLILCVPSMAQDAQWRGPDRNGMYPGSGLLKEWPENGPEMILKVEGLGGGHSSPILFQDRIYITGKKGELDYLSAVDMQGNLFYQVSYGRAWDETYAESRCTPTLDGDRIYVVSGKGEIVCLNAENGEKIWTVNAHEKYRGELHRWGIAESPLIVDDKVIYTTGGNVASVIALNKYNGEEVWKTKSTGDSRAFVSPVFYENGNIRLILAVTANYVLGISPEDGSISAQYTYLPDDPAAQRGATNNTNSPLIRGDEIFVSKGYDQYGVMLKIGSDGKALREMWKSSTMDTHHGHYVYDNGYLFGSNWLNNSKGNWVCLDWKTGKVMFEDEWITKGSIVYADGLLYCYEERSGNVALVNPTPEKFDVISRFTIAFGSGPHWAHPYISDGKMLIRHGDVLMVFHIKA